MFALSVDGVGLGGTSLRHATRSTRATRLMVAQNAERSSVSCRRVIKTGAGNNQRVVAQHLMDMLDVVVHTSRGPRIKTTMNSDKPKPKKTKKSNPLGSLVCCYRCGKDTRSHYSVCAQCAGYTLDRNPGKGGSRAWIVEKDEDPDFIDAYSDRQYNDGGNEHDVE